MDESQSRAMWILEQPELLDEARAELLELVYDQLRLIAHKRMAEERAGHTLQATALVHEAYLRLIGDRRLRWGRRGEFYGAASEAMRRILRDHARRKGSKKRGEGKAPLPLSVVDLAEDPDPGQVLALDEALARLEQEDRQAASVVKLRFYAGLSVAETAAALEVSERTVMREWTFARARLFEPLEDASEG